MPEIGAMPNNAVVDVSNVKEGCVDSTEYVAAIADPGTGVTVLTGSKSLMIPSDNIVIIAPGSHKVIPILSKFKCHAASCDGFFGTKDEIY